MKSIWQNDIRLPEFPKLKGNYNTDVLIIGGGMAGILTAYFLKKNGINCVLAEKGKICCGTTAGTTAKITFQHGLIYNELLQKSGIETAKGYLQANRLAFEHYADMCKEIDCDYEIKDNYVYSLDSKQKLEDELSALEKIGYNAELCENLPIPLNTAGAVKFTNQAQFHPLKFIRTVADGLPIYENTFVRELCGNTAVTDCGSIKAEHIIIATHFPFINKHGSYFLKLYQHRSYMLALKNVQYVNGMYSDENRTGISFRNYKEFLIIGGGSHRTGKNGGNWTELRDFANHNYPQAKECFYWAAQDCMSLDKIPYIGEYSGKTSKLYTATGFNKWGMTGSMLSAILLCDLVQGRRNEFEKLFSPSRSILKPQLFVNGFEAVKNLLSFGKRCPHMGCALKWNSSEHSWDCACHGSRFDKNGRILNNPANSDLEN